MQSLCDWNHKRRWVGNHVHSELRRRPVLGWGLVRGLCDWDHKHGRVGNHVHSELRYQPVLGRGLVRGVPGKLDQRGRRLDVLYVPGKQVRRQVWVDLDVRRLHGGKDKGCKLGHSRDW